MDGASEIDKMNIIKLCSVLKEQGDSLDIEQLKQSFDGIIFVLDKNKTLSEDVILIKEIVQVLLDIHEKILCESDLIDHRLIVLLRHWYLILLQRWRTGEQLDTSSDFVFDALATLFVKMSSRMSSDHHLSILKKLLFYEPLIEELSTCLEEIAMTGKYLLDRHIKSIDSMFRTYQHLKRGRFDIQKESILLRLFHSVVKCICSSSFIDMFIQSMEDKNDYDPNIGRKFLLETCTDYIYAYSGSDQHKQSLHMIRQTLLRPFVQWFTDHACSFQQWNYRMTGTLRQLCFMLTFSIQLDRYSILDETILQSYYRLIDAFIHILDTIIRSENLINTKLAQSLMGTLTPNLYTMTLAIELERFIKTKHITLLILKLTEIDIDEIQLNAYRILPSIMTESDMIDLNNSKQIVQIFLTYFNKIIADPQQIWRLHTLLRSLKSLLQHDQIKREMIQQDCLPSLFRCATETQFNTLQLTLEIFLILTFDTEASHCLKKHSDLISSFLTSSQRGVSRAAECLLWKLNQKEETRTADMRFTYDIMLSYSYSDEELCYRLHDRLIEDHFRVWLDRDQMFGATMISIAKAIENSQFVFICMSEEYKQNPFCRCEAHYAFERQSQLIPLIVQKNYRPDGWLSALVSEEASIDFHQLDFEQTYIKLKIEIENQRNIISPVQPPSPLSCIDQWTKDDVKSFLLIHRLDSLLPLVAEMNGCLVRDLYTMCKENRESMFHTLKSELATLSVNHQPLLLLHYLRFLDEIEKYLFLQSN